MSNILAEVEGICLHERVEHMADFLPGPYYWCEDCKKELSELDYHSRQREFPDYPSDLEACMRVLFIMGLSFHIGNYDVFDLAISHDEMTVLGEGVSKSTLDYDPNNLAATLYPMLVEIAEEGKG